MLIAPGIEHTIPSSSAAAGGKDHGITAPPPVGQLWRDRPGFDRDFVERLLGRRRRRGLSGPTARRLAALEPELPELLDPQVIYTTLPPTVTPRGSITLNHSSSRSAGAGLELTNPKMIGALQKAAKAVCLIATVGPELDRRVAELQGEGRLADAAILDALGSGAVEWLADRFLTHIVKEHDGLVAGPRFSPGYCDWPLNDQPGLFSLLDHRQIGVELDASCLMQPRKSISALFGLYETAAAPADRDLIPCRRCPKRDCIARR
ncbi:vitamin B12 dependent-methionine synthase activation domain-containing protein [Desulfurivibrio dismutans]|uniref:vitamin B12 dependent-methionine synthase activation domain-containing protein n=1 Tax=Desulfurivibrio dismutans TaxID=1398908 RepID=UPI0023DA06F6|nr:vitamin B12 dependent-methionine synthase activation domain-containing protein [Desulfurivibrio alkaliphilus]MDF1614317.1 vitamin B12 dependent-methionine synthase activation domain-containing protein [Desulfurivibrio alkaliphilus]